MGLERPGTPHHEPQNLHLNGGDEGASRGLFSAVMCVGVGLLISDIDNSPVFLDGLLPKVPVDKALPHFKYLWFGKYFSDLR